MKISKRLEISTDEVKSKLVAFIRENIEAAKVENVVLGLSGGVDSALTCALSVAALGADNVVPIIMPSAQSNPESAKDAMHCIEKAGIQKWHQVSVSPQVEEYFGKAEVPESDDEFEMKNRIGNKSARERMTILYDFSVIEKALVIGTSNKTEILLGYGTLFGDTACAINPIGQLYKMQVFKLAEYMGVPKSVLDKPPSADLWQGQTDEDQLGFTYAQVDSLLLEMVDYGHSKEELVDMGFEEDFIAKVSKMMSATEFKRRLPLIAQLG